MDELGFDFNNALDWFNHHQDNPYFFVKLTPDHVKQLLGRMPIPLRRCYITDDAIKAAAGGTPKFTHSQILASRLPDKGSVMAGDFGEILCYFYQSAQALPEFAIGAKKWRLKQDRTKPAPKADVIHFVMPEWPNASPDDVIYCSEVKVKSTATAKNPISEAITGAEKDRTSRLANTLIWLRERSMTESLGDKTTLY